MKKLLVVFIALALIAGVGVMRAEAQTDTIEVTVTIQNIAVTVTPEGWDLSTTPILAGSSNELLTPSATNSGNVTEDLTISIDTSGTSWTSGTTASENEFVMGYCADGVGSYTAIGTGTPSLTDGLSAGNSYAFDLEFIAPDPDTLHTMQTIGVVITASASAS